jgi:V8-like Glu-specific endopeptidase
MRRLCMGLAATFVATALWHGGPVEAEAVSAAQVYREASPAVVVIFGFDKKGAGSSGTGTVVTKDGMILTNNHVIFDQKTKQQYANIQIYFKPTRVTGDDKVDLAKAYKVRVLARDTALDLALLRLVGPPADLAVIEVGDSEEVEIGERVAAIGHPGGGGLWTLTTGTISSTRKDGSRDIFQTDAAINPGNSGGPLLDEQARLIGVNTFVRRVNKQGLPLEGLNYSLRSALAVGWLNDNGLDVAMSRRPVQVAASASTPERTNTGIQPKPAPQPNSELPSDTPATPESAPESMPHVTPEPAPSIPAPRAEPTPEPLADEDPPDADDFDDLQEFRGENGETMYGVPNRNFRLDNAMKAVYQEALKSSSEAFDELDTEFDTEF